MRVWVSGRNVHLLGQPEYPYEAAALFAPEDLEAFLAEVQRYGLTAHVIDLEGQELTQEVIRLSRLHHRKLAEKRLLETMEPSRPYTLAEIGKILLVADARYVADHMVQRGLLTLRPHKPGPGGYPRTYILEKHHVRHATEAGQRQ